MGLRCKSEKIGDGIFYIMIKNERSEYDIEFKIYDNIYETIAETQNSAQRWIEQHINEIK